MNEDAAHVLELIAALAWDWQEIRKAAERGPRACRRTVRALHKVHTLTLAELRNMSEGGKPGEMFAPGQKP